MRTTTQQRVRAVGGAVLAVLLAAGLAGCEKSQDAGRVNTAKKSDARAWEGADPAYQAGGWKAGDKVAWEAELRKRNEAQNEYARVR